MRAAVLGSPIAHSLSPRLHRAAYAALGLDWTYDAVELTPHGLPAFLAGLGPDWAGLSLTMPLKESVLALLDEVSELARAVQAANTVVLREGRRHGDNTDVHGLVASLADAGVRQVAPSTAAVLGGGATARSALAALARLGERSPVLVTRSEPTATLAAAERLGVRPTVLPWRPAVLAGLSCELLISTVPAGVADELAGGPMPAGLAVLVDVVYAPWPTALARACGGAVVGGAAMLLHQAARQVELMTGRPAPLEAMRAALTAADG